MGVSCEGGKAIFLGGGVILVLGGSFSDERALPGGLL